MALTERQISLGTHAPWGDVVQHLAEGPAYLGDIPGNQRTLDFLARRGAVEETADNYYRLTDLGNRIVKHHIASRTPGYR